MAGSMVAWLLSLILVLGIAMGNSWMHGLLAGTGEHGLRWIQLWSGVAVLLGLTLAAACTGKRFARTRQAPADRSAWPRAAVWLVACGVVPWMTLPAAGVLGPAAAAAFWLLLGIRRGGDVRLLSPWGRALFAGGLLFGLLAAAVALLDLSPYRLGRILSDFAGPLDLDGRHYFHGVILRTLGEVRLLGEAGSPLPLHFDRLRASILLGIAHGLGALPAALLAALLLLGWQRLFIWLRGVVPGPLLSAPMRDLGLMLIGLHGFTTLTGCLWDFGITRQPFGPGLAPLTVHASWWVLSAALIGVLACAYRQRLRSTPETPRIRQSFWGGAGVLTAIVAVITCGLLFAIDRVADFTVDRAWAAPAANRESPARREIADRHGKIIATSMQAFDLWVIPERFWGRSLANPAGSAAQASQLQDTQRRERLLQSLADWPQLRTLVKVRLDRYAKSQTRPGILAWGVRSEVAEKIAGSGLQGLRLTPRPVRHYPQGGLFAHVLGFASLSDPSVGQEGLELALWRTASGLVDGAGPTLRLTLDAELQRAASDALLDGGAVHDAVGGALVIVEAATGKIRAMVSAPGFDANDDATYRNPYRPERVLNRARINFPVGSLITPLLAAHLIETGRMQSETRITAGRQSTIGRAAIDGPSAELALSMAEIVVQSPRIGLARLMLSLPVAELGDVIRHLGIGVPLRIRGVPGNIDQEPVDWSAWTPEMHAQPGMHIQTNLLQLTQAYLPLAHGGVLKPLQLLEESPEPFNTPVRVLSPDTVNAMREILGVAAGQDTQGVLSAPRFPGIAGKSAGGRDAEGRPMAAFVGMVPASQPRWLIGVLLQYQQQPVEPYGGLLAPVVAKLLDRIGSIKPESTDQSLATAMYGFPESGSRSGWCAVIFGDAVRCSLFAPFSG